MTGYCAYRLCDDSFFRSYEAIGVLYNQVTRSQKIFDQTGSIFLQQIGRQFKPTNLIAKSLSEKFCKADGVSIQKDFHDFAVKLEQEGFLEIENIHSSRLAKSSPIKMCGAASMDEDCGVVNAARFLKTHFETNPRVFSFQYSTTEKCNEKCVHCYVDTETKEPLSQLRSLEIIDELKELGTLDITFTGGEALSCSRLPLLIAQAKKNDLVISLLSNLTLLTEELCSVIKSANLQLVQTSVFSMDPEVHDSITRRAGSHVKTISALEKLKSAGVRVDINCPILVENFKSFESVLSYGRDNGIHVRCDLKILAKENGDKATLAHRVAGVGLERAMAKIISFTPHYESKIKSSRAVTQRQPIGNCGIGTYRLSMKSDGQLFPCPGSGQMVGLAAKRSIRDVWVNSPDLKRLRNMDRRKSYPQCIDCIASNYCAFCPAKFISEVRLQENVIPKSFCKIAHANRRVVLRGCL